MPAPHASTFHLGRVARLCIIGLVVLLGGRSVPVSAGGPILVTTSGRPYHWDQSQAIQYTVDQGRLASRSHAATVAMIQQALQAWHQVPFADLQFVAAPEIPMDITGSNVLNFLDGLQFDDPSPIFLDSDGAITNILFGQGASDGVLGFSEPFITDPRSGTIYVSFSVINGPLHEQLSDAYLLGTFAHELGHFVNLSHSLVNAQMLTDGDPTNDFLLPALFYRGPNDPGTVAADDQAWVSWLYPSGDYAASTGSIRGRVLLPDGVTGYQGIHVVARRVGDPLVTAVGAVSGFLFKAATGGVNDPARMGEFLVPRLPPGSYTLEVEQLESFPAIPVPIAYLIGGHKFWHEGSSAQNSPTASSTIVVAAGQDVTGIDIVLNGRSLGQPKPVAKKGPNALPNAQVVDLPAVITGTMENSGTGNGPDDSGTSDTPDDSAGPPITSEKDLQDVYRVTVGEPTVVTAILSAASVVDLDLYVLASQNGQRFLVGSSIGRATPPEVVQLYLPAGVYYYGIHRAGTQGGDYTLQLLASPAPDPDPLPDPVVISYLLIGNVTSSGAVAHWQTTTPTPSVLYYGLPQHEIGSKQFQTEHMLALTDVTAGLQSPVDVLAGGAGGIDELISQFTTAAAVDPGGAPNIVATSSVEMLDTGVALVTVRLTNKGSGKALNVQLNRATVASGWRLLSQLITGEPLPLPLDAGEIGAGGAGALSATIYQRSGTTAPAISAHGTYTDAAGGTHTF